MNFFTAARDGISKCVRSVQDPVPVPTPYPTLGSSEGSFGRPESEIQFLTKDFSFPPPTLPLVLTRGPGARCCLAMCLV